MHFLLNFDTVPFKNIDNIKYGKYGNHMVNVLKYLINIYLGIT